MLLSKANLYNESDQITSFYARSFTHPARLQIIRSLREQQQLTVQELSLGHPLSLPGLSQHLELLRSTQILSFKTHYPFLLYSLNEDHFKEACEYLSRFLNES